MAGSNRIARAGLRVLLGVLLLGVAWHTYKVRRQLIRTWFSHGSGGAAAPSLPSPKRTPTPAGLSETERVRVVLIDGLDAAASRQLPNYNAVCARGLDLTIDVGFPTVSLPVQHALWTGLTQQQTGIAYSNDALKTARAETIPAQVRDSRAVSEAYQRIAQSVGFARVDPAQPKRVDPHWSLASSWRRWLSTERFGDFERVAVAAVGGDARLVFVHVLRVDAIAHRKGTQTEYYASAARWADRLLGRLIAEDNSAHPHKQARWFVMSDHGHHVTGGHGDAEPAIRLVRACVAGDVARRSGEAHLIDLSRALADSLGVHLDGRAVGRPLYAAMAAPAPGATLPRPGPQRWLLALLLVIAALIIVGATARAWWYWPLWMPVAFISLLALESSPTMSGPLVYHSFRSHVYFAIVPGLVVLAVNCALILRIDSAWRVATTQVLPAVAAIVAMLVLCRGEDHLTLAGDTAALMPWWSAQASVSLAGLYVACFVAALAMFVSVTFVPRRSV